MNSGGERTIRVFISSTFRDMHAERDVLNRMVFPELRSRCLRRGAEFIGLDLRWGVTEEEAQGEGALAICLDEIERCRPFFVCLLGDRFGWVPPPEELPASLFEAVRSDGGLPDLIAASYHLDETVDPPVYRLRREPGETMPDDVVEALVRFWEAHGLPGAGDSITAREILRGVFEEGYPPTHALFYIRGSGVDRNPAFPPVLVPTFVEQNAGRRQKLDDLKARIRARGEQILVREYDARYAGARIDPAFLPPHIPSSDRLILADGLVAPEEWAQLSVQARATLEKHGTVALTSMDVFAERLVDDLWRAIEPELDRPVADLDAHQRERLYHERFVADRTRLFLGRADERARIVGYVGDAADRTALVVTGDPGCGKSAFMAECVGVCRELHPGALVLPHFIGVSPGSASLAATLQSLCETLRRELTLEEPVEADPQKRRVQLRTFLEKASAGRQVILFIDALNQLDPAGRGHDLDWLPSVLPAGVKLVVSTLPGDCLDQLRRRVPEDHVVVIPLLPMDERRALVERFLAARRKKLSQAQIHSLLDIDKRPDGSLPLYLLVALEELCLFGDYQALTDRIDRLPSRLPELFTQVLARLEHDHGRPATASVCTWLAVSRSGLLESEVLDLLGSGGTFARIQWTRLYRALEPYLKPTEDDATPGSSGGGRLDFFHDQLRFAVQRRYLDTAAGDEPPGAALRAAHEQLARHFRSVSYDKALEEHWRTDQVRGLSELPFHQTRSEMWDEVTATLCDLNFIAAKCAAGMTYDLVGDYESASNALPEGLEQLERERQRKESLDRYTRELIEYARRWTEGIPLPSPPLLVRWWTRDEVLADTTRIIQSPTRLDRVRAFAQFVGAQSHRLNRFAAVPGFCLGHAYNSASGGPVVQAAEALIREGAGRRVQLLLRSSGQREPWNGHPAIVRSLEGHTNSVHVVAGTPDGRRAVSGSQDKTLRVWDVETGRCLHTFFHPDEVNAVAITPDGRRAVSGCKDMILRAWDVEAGRCFQTLEGHTASIEAVDVTPDGRLAVSGGDDQTVRLWDLQSGHCIHALQAHDVAQPPDANTGVFANSRTEKPDWPSAGIHALAITPDGRRAVSGHGNWLPPSDNTVCIWDLEAGQWLATLVGHSELITAIAMTPDGRRAISASDDNTLRLWDLEAHQCLRTLQGHSWVKGVAMTPDSRRAVSGSWDRTVRVWDLETGEQSVIGLTTIGAFGMTITGDGRLAVSAGGNSKSLLVWDLERGQSVSSATERHQGLVGTLKMMPNGRHAVSAGYSNLRLWDCVSGQCLRVFWGHTGDVYCVAVTPDGKHIVSGSEDKTVRVWDVTTGSCVRTLDGHSPLMAVAVTPDGRRVVCGYRDAALCVFELATGRRLHTLPTPSAGYLGIMSLTVAPEGRRALAGTDDSALRVWDLETGQPLQVFTGHRGEVGGIAVTPDGLRAASLSYDSTLRLWDLITGESIKVLDCHFHPTALQVGGGAPVVIAPSGLTAITGSMAGIMDGLVREWQLSSATCREMADRHEAGAGKLAIAPDGGAVVSGSRDGTVRLWDLAGASCQSVFAGDDFVCSLAMSWIGVLFGTYTGTVNILHSTQPLYAGAPVLTPTRIWRYGDGTHAGRWDEHLRVVCAWCGHDFAVAEPAATSVSAVSPVEIACPSPSCGKPLRVNAFACEPRAWPDSPLSEPSIGGASSNQTQPTPESSGHVRLSEISIRAQDVVVQLSSESAGHSQSAAWADAMAHRNEYGVADMFRAPAGRWGSGDVLITDVALLDANGTRSPSFRGGDPMAIHLKVRAVKPTKDLVFGIAVFNAAGICCYGTNTHVEKIRPLLPDGDAEVSFTVDSLDLVAGDYKLDVAVHSRTGIPYDYHRLLHTFSVFSEALDPGIYRQRHRWTFSLNVRFEP